MYCLVEFASCEIETIHSSWVEQQLGGGNMSVAFPPKQEYHRVRQMLRNESPPGSSWQTYKVKLLYSHSSYDKVTSKSGKYCKSGSISSTDTEAPRKRTAPAAFEENESDEEATPRKPKRRQIRAQSSVTVPSLPAFPAKLASSSPIASHRPVAGNISSTTRHTLTSPTAPTTPTTRHTLTPPTAPLLLPFPAPQGVMASAIHSTITSALPKAATASGTTTTTIPTAFCGSALVTAPESSGGSALATSTSAPTASMASMTSTTSTTSVTISSTSADQIMPPAGQADELANTSVETNCHCLHMQQWQRETFAILMRLEDKIDRLSNTRVESSEVVDELQLPRSAEGISEFFVGVNASDATKKRVVSLMKLEVRSNLFVSIKQMLLAIAPSDAWSEYSKAGQRGKRSASEIGILPLLIRALRCTTYHSVQTAEERLKVEATLGDVLKRMPSNASRRDVRVDRVVAGGSSRSVAPIGTLGTSAAAVHGGSTSADVGHAAHPAAAHSYSDAGCSGGLPQFNNNSF